MTKRLLLSIVICVAMLTVSKPAAGQAIFGNISGTVRDPSGSAVVGAKITVSDVGANLPEAHYTLGIIAWQSGDFARASARMRSALSLKPDYGEAWFTLGTALKQSGELHDAEDALRNAIRYAPGDPGPYNALGQLLRQKGDLEGSRVSFALGAGALQSKNAALGTMLQKSRK